MNRTALVGVLLLGVLSCLTDPTDALKCILCENCKESDKSLDPQECTKLHLPESVKSFSKFLGLDKEADQLDEYAKNMRNIKTCYITTQTRKGIVTVDRGCGPHDAHANLCEVKESVETCQYTCAKDGCNHSVPTPPPPPKHSSAERARLSLLATVALLFLLINNV